MHQLFFYFGKQFRRRDGRKPERGSDLIAEKGLGAGWEAAGRAASGGFDLENKAL